jgi:hypothetical protein
MRKGRDRKKIEKWEVTAMKDQLDWRENPRIMLPLVLAVLSPGIAKILLTIIRLF